MIKCKLIRTMYILTNKGPQNFELSIETTIPHEPKEGQEICNLTPEEKDVSFGIYSPTWDVLNQRYNIYLGNLSHQAEVDEIEAKYPSWTWKEII